MAGPAVRRAASGAAATVLLCTLAPSATAQGLGIGDPREDYARVLSLVGRAAPASWTIRPLAAAAALAGADSSDHPWRGQLRAEAAPAGPGALRIVAAPAALRLFANSAVPAGQNDGAVWQGRGLTAALEGGVVVRYGALSIALRPQLVYTRNAPFTLMTVTDTTRTAYANPWHPRAGLGAYIDLPQRFGPDPYWTLDAGQSSIRVDWRGTALGVSTGNLWWGPGLDNAIMMSNNAPGFPHVFLATGRPVDIGIGRVEAQWIWGRLTQSRWSERQPSGVRRFLTGAVGSLQPRGLPGLTLGATRLFYLDVPPGGVGFRDLLLVVQGLTKQGFADSTNPAGNDRRDQLAGLFARWAIPRSGFEAYVEWGRNDHSWDIRDLILEPEHTQAYTLGFQQVAELRGGRLLRLRGELTHLERSNTFVIRSGTPYWYAHHLVRDGYTERGQVIGAGIGPGGNAQVLGADLFARWGSAGLYARRQVHDNDAHFDYFAAAGATDWNSHDVTAGLGARGVVFARGLAFQWQAEWMLERNRYFRYLNDVSNVHAELTVRWTP